MGWPPFPDSTVLTRRKKEIRTERGGETEQGREQREERAQGKWGQGRKQWVSEIKTY